MNLFRRLVLPAVCASLLTPLLLSSAAQAHPFQYTAFTTSLTAQDTTISLRTQVPQAVAIKPKAGQDEKTLYQDYFKINLRVGIGMVNCPFTLVSHQIDTNAKRSVFEGTYTCPSPVTDVKSLAIYNQLFADQFETYSHYVTVTIAQKNWSLLFTLENQQYPGIVRAIPETPQTPATPSQPTTPSASVDSLWETAKEFFVLGVEHIWTGYDHLLFLILAILLLRKIKKILIVVTAFTLAHSITLTLATLHIVTVPAHIVEPIITLSIVYLAVRNIMALRHKEVGERRLSERWATAFGFGLIHGLGFAGALQETEIPQQFFAAALAFFNIGIEGGQLAVLLLVVPALLWLDKSAYQRVVSVLVSVLGGLWAAVMTVQRVLGVG